MGGGRRRYLPVADNVQELLLGHRPVPVLVVQVEDEPDPRLLPVSARAEGLVARPRVSWSVGGRQKGSGKAVERPWKSRESSRKGQR